nr:MAG TPA_asm: hypothetical protein [Caudoviricetes sp.]
MALDFLAAVSLDHFFSLVFLFPFLPYDDQTTSKDDVGESLDSPILLFIS